MGFLQFVNPLPRNATDYEGIVYSSFTFFNFNNRFVFYIYIRFDRYVLLAEIWSRESSKDPSSSK